MSFPEISPVFRKFIYLKYKLPSLLYIPLRGTPLCLKLLTSVHAQIAITRQYINTNSLARYQLETCIEHTYW